MMRRLLLSALILLLHFGVQAQQYQDEIRKSIFFGGGSYFVDEVQIDELYHWLDSVPNLLEKYDIHLISHTDPIGGKEYNEWLSKMRSEAVQQIILNRGDISERKITIKDWGLDNPVYSNTSYGGMQMNRRVDVILYPIIF
ncbi:MAG TPA: OmpA family protein [Chryseolinea sp.]|nr:OmpA family protein [Chryseolinea sp.]